MKCGIYKITSPTKKIYIGQSVDIIGRWNHYKKYRCKSQQKIYHSLIKHGSDLHTFEILELCDRVLLGEREMHYIRLYDSFNTEHGLNLSVGGGASSPKSEETKRKIGLGNKGKVISIEQRMHLSKVNTGKVQSEETRAKRSASLKGKLHTEAAKKKISLSKQNISIETREKLRLAATGRKQSILAGINSKIALKNKVWTAAERKFKSDWKIAHPTTRETFEKISKSLTGRSLSESHKENLKKAWINRRLNIKAEKERINKK